MAEAGAAGTTPTFKLVLVGDGGTGKVCILSSLCAPHRAPRLAMAPERWVFDLSQQQEKYQC